MPTAQQFTHMSPVIQLLPGARRGLRAALQAYNDAMRLKANCRVDFGDEGDLFLMFHGYGNDEREMIRIIDAVDAEADYYSFRGTYARRYMGGNYWYPDGCDVESRRRECRVVGDAVVALTGSAAFAGRRKILIGFSQGGYLSYRMAVEHPGVFDAAILLSPSFRGEQDAEADCGTRFLLAYGDQDRTIPVEDQDTARRVISGIRGARLCTYPGMAHAICDREIDDIRDFLR